MPRAVSLLLAAALLLAAPTPAAACGQGGLDEWDLAMLGQSLIGVPVDLGLTIHDVAVDDSSLPYAVVETVLTGAAVLHALVYLAMRPHGEVTGPALVSLVWNGALLAHGVYEWREGSDDGASARPVMVGLSGTW